VLEASLGNTGLPMTNLSTGTPLATISAIEVDPHDPVALVNNSSYESYLVSP